MSVCVNWGGMSLKINSNGLCVMGYGMEFSITGTTPNLNKNKITPDSILQEYADFVWYQNFGKGV